MSALSADQIATAVNTALVVAGIEVDANTLTALLTKGFASAELIAIDAKLSVLDAQVPEAIKSITDQRIVLNNARAVLQALLAQ